MNKMLECPKCFGLGKIPDPVAFGLTMRNKRVVRKMGLRETAIVMQVSAPYLHDMETGKRRFTPEMLKKFNQAIAR